MTPAITVPAPPLREILVRSCPLFLCVLRVSVFPISNALEGFLKHRGTESTESSYPFPSVARASCSAVFFASLLLCVIYWFVFCGCLLPNISYRQFVLGKLVGSGSLGKVYRARLQAGGQDVAVKFMHRDLWTDRDSRDSFLREIDHASKIHHSGVVKYFGWGQSPHGGPYLVSEYVDGRSLANVKPNGSETAVQWLVQICEAVAAAHQAGVVHGDLTPNNILLDHNGRIVVTDFGFATYSPKSTSDDVVFDSNASRGGTLGFAAPEQISPAFGSISYATDIYAIGGLAFYLLTGRSPHDCGSLLDTVTDDDLIVPTAPVTPSESKLVAIAELAMKKAIVSRPHSVTELIPLLVD